MTRLPPALAAWGPELSELPEDVVAALEPWLVRLSAALGPLAHRAERGPGTPDGFEGLTRRGSYDRLLATEWALAEAHPDEFARRAANAEHLFYRLAEQRMEERHRTVLLFDAGPEQLGAPRLTHLAFLLTMAARARRAGVDLFWGVMQGAERWRREVTPEAVIELVRGRDAGLPTRARLEAWQASLPEGPVRGEQLWLVGGPQLQRIAPPGASLALATEPLEAGARTVALELHPATGSKRRLSFALPDTPLAVRLLRDPFEAWTRAEGGATTVAPAPMGDTLCFALDGRAVFARVGDGVVSHVLPTGDGAPPLPRRLSAQGGTPVGVGRVQRHFVLAVLDGGRSKLMFYSRRGRWKHTQPLTAPDAGSAAWSPAAQAVLPLLVTLGGNRSPDLVLLDGLGRALRLPREGGTLEVLLDGVTAVGRCRDQTVLVIDRALMPRGRTPLGLDGPRGPLTAKDLPRRAILRLDAAGRLDTITTLPEGDGDYAARITHAGVAVRVQPDTWFVWSPREEALVPVPGGRILGAALEPGADADGPSLLRLGEDGQTVYAERAQGRHELGRLARPARAAVLCPTDLLVAYVTPQGHLRVEDPTSGRLRLGVTPEVS